METKEFNVDISAFLERFRCIICKNVDYPSIIISGFPIEGFHICKICLKIDNRDSIIEKILN